MLLLKECVQSTALKEVKSSVKDDGGVRDSLGKEGQDGNKKSVLFYMSLARRWAPDAQAVSFVLSLL